MNEIQQSINIMETFPVTSEMITPENFGFIPHYFFDAKKKACEQFILDCHGNEGQFSDISDSVQIFAGKYCKQLLTSEISNYSYREVDDCHEYYDKPYSIFQSTSDINDYAYTPNTFYDTEKFMKSTWSIEFLLENETVLIQAIIQKKISCRTLWKLIQQIICEISSEYSYLIKDLLMCFIEFDDSLHKEIWSIFGNKRFWSVKNIQLNRELYHSFLERGVFVNEIWQKIKNKKASDMKYFRPLYQMYCPDSYYLQDFINSGKGETREFYKYFPRIVGKQSVSYSLMNNFSRDELLIVLGNSSQRLTTTIQKTGSDLSILLMKENFYFSHTLNCISGNIWKKLSQEKENIVPVAPISKSQQRGKIMTLVSRYCGESLNECLVHCQGHPDVFSEIMKQKWSILTLLKKKGITHGHPHNENFVVECVGTNYLKQQKNAGKTVNTLHYDPASFVPFKTALQLKNEYTYIVRLIDRDQAYITE